MSTGQQFDYDTHKQNVQGTANEYYTQVAIQPPTTRSTSSSSNTPPSPVSRRTVGRPSQSQSTHSNHRSTINSIEFSSSFRGPSTQVRKEREKQLSNTPKEALIQLAIKREYEAKKAKQLLTTAVLQLEVVKEHLAREEEARKDLEQEKHLHGIKTTQAVLKAQTDSINVQQEIGRYKLQVENMQRDLNRANEAVRKVEDDRDEAERALIRARANAREMKEKNVLLLAREEGRREGFDEGLRQGRLALATVEPPLIANGPTSAEGSTTKGRKELGDKPRRAHKSSNATPTATSFEAEGAQTKLREIDEQEKLRTKMQLLDAEKKLDREIQHSKDAERKAQHLLEERRRIEEEKRRLEEERDRERRARKEAEREMEEYRIKQEGIIRMEYEKRQIYEARERELKELRKEKERLEKEKAEAVAMARKDVDHERERTRRLEEEREREHEREREREERDRERAKEKEQETAATIAAATAAAITAAVGAAKSGDSRHGSTIAGSPPPNDASKMPYLPMPAPPIVPGPGMPIPMVSSTMYSGVPRATSSGSYRAGRRTSLGSASSSMASGLPLDMLQFPSERDMRGDLSVILEDTSMRGSTPGRPQSRANSTRGPQSSMEGWGSAVHSSQSEYMEMPKAPGDPGYIPPSTMAPSNYQSSTQMPRAPGDGPGPGYQPPPAMPTAPGEGPAYHPPFGTSPAPRNGPLYSSTPVAMPLAPGEAPPSYQNPPPGASGPGYNSNPLEMPRAPGEAPATYIPPVFGGDPSYPGSTAPLEMPRAPGEAPATYIPPASGGAPGTAYASSNVPFEMPRAPGEAPATYKPPASGVDSAGYPSTNIAMPRAPGEGPTTYIPPPSGGGSAYSPAPISMPQAPGEGHATYRPPPSGMSRAPSEGTPYRPPVDMSRLPSERSPYKPSFGLPKAPSDGTPYQPPMAMQRAPSEAPLYIPPADMARGGRGLGSSMAMPRAPSDGPTYVPPPRTPSAMGSRNGSAGGYTPNNDLLTPHGSNRNGPIRRPSNGSNSSYEFRVEPPSRPPSGILEDQDRDPSAYLSPNARPAPLPQVQQQQILPTRPRGILRTNSDTVTQPDSPAETFTVLPANFIPQTLTDRHGISTPISHPPVLPGMGPVIPVIPRPASAQGPYGNPLANKSQEHFSPPTVTRSPFIPPTALGGAGSSSPHIGAGWGSRAGSRTGSIGGATPKTPSMDLPGQRSGLPIYGPPAGGAAGFVSPNVRLSAIPPSIFNTPDDESDGFDQTTLQNTLLNTNVPAAPTVVKKKKKGRK